MLLDMEPFWWFLELFWPGSQFYACVLIRPAHWENHRQPLQPKVRWGRIIALELAGFSALGLLSVIGGRLVDRAELGLDGGFVGWGLAELVAVGLKFLSLDRNLWGGLVFGLIILLCLGYGLGLVTPLLKGLQKMAEVKPPIPVVNEPVISVAPSVTQTGASLPGVGAQETPPTGAS